MLKIYTGNNSESLKGIKAKYEFPENGLSGWEQIDWMEEKLEEFKGDDEVIVKTFSPYILNYLNLWLARGDMGYENLGAFEMYLDETLEEPLETSLKILNEGVKLIDTRSLSDPITYIYERYDKEKLSIL